MVSPGFRKIFLRRRGRLLGVDVGTGTGIGTKIICGCSFGQISGFAAVKKSLSTISKLSANNRTKKVSHRIRLAVVRVIVRIHECICTHFLSPFSLIKFRCFHSDPCRLYMAGFRASQAIIDIRLPTPQRL